MIKVVITEVVCVDGSYQTATGTGLSTSSFKSATNQAKKQLSSNLMDGSSVLKQIEVSKNGKEIYYSSRYRD